MGITAVSWVRLEMFNPHAHTTSIIIQIKNIINSFFFNHNGKILKEILFKKLCYEENSGDNDFMNK